MTTYTRPPLTVAALRSILADTPDDALVRVNLARAANEWNGPALPVREAEYLAPEQWHDEAGVLLQIFDYEVPDAEV